MREVVTMNMMARLSFPTVDVMPNMRAFSSFVGWKIMLAEVVAPANHWASYGLGSV